MAADAEPTSNCCCKHASFSRYDADAFVADDQGDLDLTTLANLKTL